MKVLYLDNHLLIVEKPAGVATQPDLEEEGKLYLKEKFNKPGNVFLHAVHRLDKPVSGIVILARTSKALSRLNQLQRERKIVKKYEALIEGRLKQKEGRLTHLLAHGSGKALVGEGKEAILDYRVLSESEGITHVEISLVTGRYHQIRAQFGANGTPILGDYKYGAKKKADRLYLHHSRSSFPHPVKEESIDIVNAPTFLVT